MKQFPRGAAARKEKNRHSLTGLMPTVAKSMERADLAPAFDVTPSLRAYRPQSETTFTPKFLGTQNATRIDPMKTLILILLLTLTAAAQPAPQHDAEALALKIASTPVLYRPLAWLGPSPPALQENRAL